MSKYNECSGMYRIIVTATDVEHRCQKISVESIIVINSGMGSMIKGLTDFTIRENERFIYKVDLEKYFVDSDKGDRINIQA